MNTSALVSELWRELPRPQHVPRHQSYPRTRQVGGRKVGVALRRRGQAHSSIQLRFGAGSERNPLSTSNIGVWRRHAAYAVRRADKFVGVAEMGVEQSRERRTLQTPAVRNAKRAIGE